MVITIIGIAIFDYVIRIKGMKLSMVQSGSPFPVWMVFYVMGVLKAQNIKFPFQTKKPWIGAGIGIILSRTGRIMERRITGIEVV